MTSDFATIVALYHKILNVQKYFCFTECLKNAYKTQLSVICHRVDIDISRKHFVC